MSSPVRPLMSFRAAVPLIAAAAALVAACAAGGRETVRVTAAATGRERRVYAAFVSMAPSLTEIVYALGAAGGLLAVTEECDYPLAAKLKPKAGHFGSPDTAKIIALRPQAVLVAEYARPEAVAALVKAGIAVETIPARDVRQVVEAVVAVGRLLGREAEARSLAAALARRIEAVEARVRPLPEAGRPTVYIEVDGPRRLYTAGGTSFMSDLVSLAGGRNVFGGRPEPYLAVDAGEVAALDPEVMFIDHPFQYKVGVGKRPGWEATKAVRTGRVYDATDFDIILMNRPGPRIVDSLEEVARLLHPGLFGPG